jgi:hypothetical protein
MGIEELAKEYTDLADATILGSARSVYSLASSSIPIQPQTRVISFTLFFLFMKVADATILGIDSVQGGIQYKASDLPFRNMPFVYI